MQIHSSSLLVNCQIFSDAFDAFPIIRELEMPVNGLRGLRLQLGQYMNLEVCQIMSNCFKNMVMCEVILNMFTMFCICAVVGLVLQQFGTRRPPPSRSHSALARVAPDRKQSQTTSSRPQSPARRSAQAGCATAMRNVGFGGWSPPRAPGRW